MSEQINTVPHNFTTSTEYSGGNVATLAEIQGAMSYPTAQWATYRQAIAQGWQVRKGEKSTALGRVVTYKKKGKETRGLKRFRVFNIAQMDKVEEVAAA